MGSLVWTPVLITLLQPQISAQAAVYHQSVVQRPHICVQMCVSILMFFVMVHFSPSYHFILYRKKYTDHIGKKYQVKCRVQRIPRRDKKAFLSNLCKEIEENNGIGKTRELF